MQADATPFWVKKIKSYLRRSGETAAARRIGAVDLDAAALPLLRALPDKQRTVAAVPDLATAERLAAELQALNRKLGLQRRIEVLPETIRGKLVISDGESARARVLLAALDNPPDLILGSVHALLAAAPDPAKTRAAEFVLRPGMTFDMAELLAKLVALDYDDELEVNVSGEFSRRGGILDIFSPAHDYPCRLEFFGDEIESIRRFQVETQRSVGKLDEYRVIAPHPSEDADKESGESFDFFDYLTPEACFLAVLHPEACRDRLEKFSGADATDRFDLVLRRAEQAQHDILLLDTAESGAAPYCECYPPLAHLGAALPAELRFGAIDLMRDMLLNQLRQWLETDHRILLSAASPGGVCHLEKWRAAHNFDPERVAIAETELASGMLLPTEKLVLLTERELFTANAFARSGAVAAAAKADDADTPPVEKSAELGENTILSDLDEGDYAVHLDHGIGRFRGIVSAASRGVKREVMKLEYADGAILHVPLSQANLVSRYLGAAGKVTLHKLGGIRWNRDKAAAGRSVRAYAADMLRLQAVRAASPGIPFPPDNLESRLFEGSFPYTDTPDQKRSTVEIKHDMERSRPMDRLLCGDVGYGKTELAMRAAFKAVSAGYQVAVLAPTTVLAQQHFYSFRERFAEQPFNIGMLSRFQTPSEQANVLALAKSGGVDIVIGTHRLCNPEVKFANLGLVVIDEEQRFGVKQKEMLRRMRADVDVLTMSATPIPRTLYLAMAGARDLSTLQTAPRLRLPVKTIIAPEDPALVAAAIRSEMERGGQTYYLHNRVRTIEECRDKLHALLPGVRFGIAHGQMPEEELGRVMKSFMNHELDCLVCSTIVESGLDIPDANTIIIERADRFGLAQLYQLRGRVGRRTQQAYAYMLLPKSQIVTGDARKRMAAIRRCSQLGAGFQLALRDLEIRGSGNILGAEQSGHLNSIGFELYCRLLKDEVAKLQGRKPEFLPNAEIALDFVVYGYEAPAEMLASALPPDYIEGVRPRIAAYRRIANVASEDALDELRNELVDRYGALPKPAENLIKITRLKILTAQAGYDSLVVADGKVMLQNGRGIYRENGKVPLIDARNPLDLRLALLRELLRRAMAANEKASTVSAV